MTFCSWLPCEDGRARCSRCGLEIRCRERMPIANCWIEGDPPLPVPLAFAAEPPSGCLAGTALKSLLASIGITATPDCPCNARANEMDRRGCDWCEENIDTIVGWLREQAEARGLPFFDAAGRVIVRRAIKNARRAAAS
jgi:hypothetical protein